METRENEERGRAIAQTLAAVVESMVQPHDSVPSAYATRSKFEAFRAPGISIRDYLLRIQKYASCSPECFVLALVYIDRLHTIQGMILTDLNVHRVLITSVVLAAKFFDDHYFNNAYYAKVGGVPCVEMNELEVDFLLRVNFTLHVTTETYTEYYNAIAGHYVFNSYRNSPRQHIRHYVAMDPESDGQLVYVNDVVEPEEPPQEPSTEELYEAHPQYQPEPAYPYQQQQVINPYAAYQNGYGYDQHTYGHQQQHQYYQQHQYQDQRPHHYQDHPQHQHQHLQHQPRTRHHSNHHSTRTNDVPVASNGKQVSGGSTTANGIVYSASSRTSGQKRRQSVALGVNA